MKPTVYDIKQSLALGPHFFSRDTLRFFGQTMSSFKTDWHNKDQGIVRVYAPMRDHAGQRMGTTERFVDINTFMEVTV
tara:strand:+ start:45 stop:278 length:234 start_codon:yes stop_codon:yes gene_type:complete